MDKISVVVPCYNEETTLNLYYQEMTKIIKKMKKVEFNFLFIDDGSTDNTLKIIKQLADKDKHINYISLSRNFGKEAAMLAGLEHATGDYVAVMDVDLQDPPRLLIEMYDLIKTKKYDCVASRRVTRKGEPIIRSWFARKFYKIINKMSKIEMVDGARDFRLMTNQMVKAVISMKEYNRYSKGLFSFVGFKTKYIEYENVERISGTTKWSLWKLFIYALDGIIAFSTMPLMVAVLVGIIFCLISFIMIIIIIIKTLCFGDPVGGWPSMVCILFFLSGIQLFCMGLMSAYLSKIYLETKSRPIYIIKETNSNRKGD